MDTGGNFSSSSIGTYSNSITAWNWPCDASWGCWRPGSADNAGCRKSDDNPIEAVVYKEQQLTEKLFEQFHGNLTLLRNWRATLNPKKIKNGPGKQWMEGKDFRLAKEIKYIQHDDPAKRKELLQAMAHGSAAAWGHLNLLGEYDFSEDKLQDSVGIKPPKLTD